MPLYLLFFFILDFEQFGYDTAGCVLFGVFLGILWVSWNWILMASLFHKILSHYFFKCFFWLLFSSLSEKSSLYYVRLFDIVLEAFCAWFCIKIFFFSLWFNENFSWVTFNCTVSFLNCFMPTEQIYPLWYIDFFLSSAFSFDFHLTVSMYLLKLPVYVFCLPFPTGYFNILVIVILKLLIDTSNIWVMFEFVSVDFFVLSHGPFFLFFFFMYVFQNLWLNASLHVWKSEDWNNIYAWKWAFFVVKPLT